MARPGTLYQHSAILKRPSMGYDFVPRSAFSSFASLSGACAIVLNAAGLNKNDASFAALLECVAVGGPP